MFSKPTYDNIKRDVGYHSIGYLLAKSECCLTSYIQ